MLKLILPFPPSINHYWVHARGRTFISNEGRRYRKMVVSLVRCFNERPEVLPLKSRLAVDIILHAGDRRRYDIDNRCKVLVDSLQHAGVYEDDSQIDDLRIRRGEITENAEVRVHVSTLYPDAPTKKDMNHVQHEA